MPASGRYRPSVKTVQCHALSKIVFEKHSYGREKKRSLKIMEDFDPRPAEYHNTAKDLLQDFLRKGQRNGLRSITVAGS